MIYEQIIRIAIGEKGEPLLKVIDSCNEVCLKEMCIRDRQYVDQGHVSEKVTAYVEQLAAAGCQGIIICNASDTEMTSAIKTCKDNKVYLAQFFRVISEKNSADIYQVAKDSDYYIGAVHEDLSLIHICAGTTGSIRCEKRASKTDGRDQDPL